MRMQTFVMAAGALVLLSGCARQTPPADARGRAERLSEQAASPDQARLWREAAARGTAAGIEQLSVPARGVETRARVTPPNRAGAEQTAVNLPTGVQGAARILAAPAIEGGFNGQAEVLKVDGERIDLNLGQQRLLSIQARAAGRPLQIKAGERAQVDYRVRDDPFDRQRIMAVRTTAGDGVVTVLDSGTKPVSVQVPLFRLVATQTGQPANGSMPVEVRVGDVRRMMATGQIADFSGVTVGVQASSALVGADAFRAEGNPYSIDLVAWVSARPK
jgi:hypothetical protein